MYENLREQWAGVFIKARKQVSFKFSRMKIIGLYIGLHIGL